jgi:hypothetical protein
VRACLQLLLFVLLVNCGGPTGPAERVLFIGNSYTSANDLPHLFATLAAAGQHALTVEMIAVGGAWSTALRADHELALWQADGSHPSLAGSFLAAGTLYATIYHQSPVGLPASAGLSNELARRLELFAAGTVLGNPGIWHN